MADKFDDDGEAPKPRRQVTQLLTPLEAAAQLGCSKKILLEHVRAGAIRYVNVGRGKKKIRRMFTEDDLAEFVKTRTQRDTPPCPSTRRKGRPTTTTTFSIEVADFTALRAAKAAERQKRQREWNDTNEPRGSGGKGGDPHKPPKK